MSSVLAPLAMARRELGLRWLSMTAEDARQHHASNLGHLHRVINASGLRDALPSPEDQSVIADLLPRLDSGPSPMATPGILLAAMLFLRPHELPRLYGLEIVPEWLKEDYLEYMLAPPSIFLREGEADDYCAFARAWTGYLHNEIARSPGEARWLQVAVKFALTASFVPLYFNRENLCTIMRHRAVILERAVEGLGTCLEHRFPPREARDRLRLGVLADHFGPQTETYAMLPAYRHLERNEFEVVLFSVQRTSHPLEALCGRSADRFVHLPPEVGQSVKTIRDADIDLLMIATNVTASANRVATLALHRLGRVQIASICSPLTTGMRHMDCFLSGRLSESTAAQDDYTERLYIMEGAAHCFAMEAEKSPSTPRSFEPPDAHHPSQGVVFVSGANYYKILPEVDEIWARILAAVPGSTLMLYPFNPNWSNTYPIGAFFRRILPTIARHGIAPDRLIVLGLAQDRAEVIGRLGLGDVYLDSFPFSGATSLLDPLEAGMPIVATDGTSFRTRAAAALLRDLGLDDLIAKDLEDYVSLAVSLGSDPELRSRTRKRVQDSMRGAPGFFDTRQYAGRVGAALAQMWRDRTSRPGNVADGL